MTSHITRHESAVTRGQREILNGHKSLIVWFTGLSGAGKSTIAHAVEKHLHQLGCRTFVFDGDNVRHGLCSDLGFSKQDRAENIRRIGEMGKLFLEAGIIALTAFISPYRIDRQKVQRLVGDEDFVEVYCRCPIEICEQRDVKGLYRLARENKINEFTGISAPYEEPLDPALVLDTGKETIEHSVDRVVSLLQAKGLIKIGLSDK